MNDVSNPERRNHRRFSVQLWVDETHERVAYYQHSANISLGGMFLEGTIPHPEGTVVTLEFTLPGDEEAITLPAQVVGAPTAEPFGMHLQFVDLEPTIRERLRQFLADHGR